MQIRKDSDENGRKVDEDPALVARRCPTALTADGRNGRGECMCACVTMHDHFVTGVEGLLLAFDHQMEVDPTPRVKSTEGALK